jgi:hypothetical protein
VGVHALGRVWNQQTKLVGAGGQSVSLSGDGNTAIVAALDGAAWIYTRSGVEWNQEAELVGAGVQSVSLSGDGNTAIVGQNNNGTAGTWVYTRSGGVWTQQLKFAEQNFSVSLSRDGNTAILGDLLDNGFVGAALVFAQPLFAGTPGKANCHGQSVSALARQYGGMNGAAAALGYAGVSALQNAILMFCGG